MHRILNFFCSKAHTELSRNVVESFRKCIYSFENERVNMSESEDSKLCLVIILEDWDLSQGKLYRKLWSKHNDIECWGNNFAREIMVA